MVSRPGVWLCDLPTGPRYDSNFDIACEQCVFQCKSRDIYSIQQTRRPFESPLEFDRHDPASIHSIMQPFGVMTKPLENMNHGNISLRNLVFSGVHDLQKDEKIFLYHAQWTEPHPVFSLEMHVLSLDLLDDCSSEVILHNVGLYMDDTRCIAFFHEHSDFFHFHADTRPAGCAIDLYCGGIGGWTHAASSLGYQVIAGIDNDFDAIQMSSKMHKADIAILEDLPSDARHVALFADVSPRAIAKVSMKRNVGMWMVSTPCPDWSLAAHQRG